MRPTDQRVQPPINVIWRMSKEKYLFVFTLQSVVWQNFGHGVYVFWACQESRTGTRQIIIIGRFFYLFLFWTSYIRLSSMVRPSVHPSIRPSPCPSVRRSVRPSKECENEQSGFCLPIRVWQWSSEHYEFHCLSISASWASSWAS